MCLVAIGYVCLYIVASSRREADSKNGLEVSPNGSRVNRYVTISSAMQRFPSEVYSVCTKEIVLRLCLHLLVSAEEMPGFHR
ncbi:hypothetical protein TNCT_157941 [Trichonephila clavata]|uniref:Uncharacterized protein n=1 Tax=Trichonephila clavata TaxID=2740835 RepID=A0A8X6HI33_TRICU|nr:hypothetical protein TNCT_157941 [Trichonephila clavata]